MTTGTFSQRIQSVRALVPGLTQRALDRLARLHLGHTWQIEEGHRENPTAKTVGKLSAALGADPQWLMFGVGTPPSAETVRAAIGQACARLNASRTARPKGDLQLLLEPVEPPARVGR